MTPRAADQVGLRLSETDMTSSPESSPVSFTVIQNSIPSIQLFKYNGTVLAETSSPIVLNGAGISQVISLENSGWSPLVPSVSNNVVSLYKAAQVIQISSLSSEAKSYLINQGWSTTLPVGKTVLYKDGKFIVIDSSNSFAIAEKISQGWTDVPPAGIIIYKGDQYAVISSGEIQSYLNDGWIFDPITAYQETSNPVEYDPYAFGMDSTDSLPYTVQSNNDILFSEGNVRWSYLGINVLDFLHTAQTVAAAMRTQEDIDNFNTTYQPVLDKIDHNRALSLSAKQIAFLFRIDPEGVRDYLYGKSESLINEVYKLLEDKDPVYYERTVTGWEETSRRPGGIWSNFSEVVSDAHMLLVRGDGMPHDLISLVLPSLLVGLTFIMLSEVALFAEAVALFGFRNALTTYSISPNMLRSMVNYQNGLYENAPVVATAEELIAMMNKRPNVTAQFAEGDAISYLKAMEAGGSQWLSAEGKSSILIRQDVATRWTCFHEWLHRYLQLRNGSNYRPGEDQMIEAFLERFKSLLNLE